MEDLEHHSRSAEIQTKKFADLSPFQVAKMYAIRYNVFVKEQRSIFNEHDGHDFEATHLFIEDGDKIVAYARVYRENETSAVLGRVAVDPEYRRQELGRRIVGQVIDTAKSMNGITQINIGAQEYLQQFYESFGFKSSKILSIISG